MAGYGGRLFDPELLDAIADWDTWDLTDIDAARAADSAATSAARPESFPRLDVAGIGINDMSVPVDGAAIAVRTYRPHGIHAPSGALVQFHGGAFCLGSIESGQCRAAYYAQHAGVTVFDVDYRLAPEHPFPTPVQDCLAVTEYLRANADPLSVDDTRIGVIGISAGGCLAAAVAQAARGAGHAPLAAQMLLWPVLDAAMRTPSMRDRREYPHGRSRRLNKCGACTSAPGRAQPRRFWRRPRRPPT